jgi:hypothetical protein
MAERENMHPSFWDGRESGHGIISRSTLTSLALIILDDKINIVSMMYPEKGGNYIMVWTFVVRRNANDTRSF